MLSEICLIIYEGNAVIERVTKSSSTKPCDLLQSLQEFQQSANAALTKMVENQGDSAGDIEIEEEDDSDEDEDTDIPASPKKRKNK